MSYIFKIVNIITCFSLSFSSLYAQNPQEIWATQKMSEMTIDEKLGQLFMVAAYSNRDSVHLNELTSLVNDYNIGGLIFFQGSQLKQAKMTNLLQDEAKIPLMIGMDAEWGTGMRLSEVNNLPKSMMLSASNDKQQVYEVGAFIAEQCKALGVHVNFAPVVDININPKNPVIGVRSFGQNKRTVATLSEAYLNGLQDNGVLGCAKHFPGHGDTESDSHKTLPAVIATKERIDSVELFPYKYLMKKGLRSIMAAHLYLPALSDQQKEASSLSPKIINGLLRGKLGFDGLVFTDALNMKGVSEYYNSGELELRALNAGNDVLLFSEDVKKAITFLKSALSDGRLSIETVNQACKRILKEKYMLKLSKKPKRIDIEQFQAKYNNSKLDFIYTETAKKAITLVKDPAHILPLQRLDTLALAAISIGNTNENNNFLSGLNRYSEVDRYVLGKTPDIEERLGMMKSIKSNNLVIIGVHANSINPSNNFGISAQAISMVRQIAAKHKTIVCVFASPYALDKFYGLKDVDAVILGYEDKKIVQDVVSQGIFGGIGFEGSLPVDASIWFKYGTGIKTKAMRLEYASPEAGGIETLDLLPIDSLMNNAISEEAYPGGQIYIARKGKVIWNKAYGYHTYDKKIPVKTTDLYDLASVTKIAATTAAVMKLTDEGIISVDSTLGKYLPEYVKGTAYDRVKIREMMTHQAGFFPWLPFYKKTMRNGALKSTVYSEQKDSLHTMQVAKDLYISASWRDSILHRIAQQPLLSRRKYKYSDFGFYMLHKIVEKLTKTSYAEYLDSVFYKPLGMSSMTFNPTHKFDLTSIAPTESDSVFRHKLVHGFVHDQGAAMMGGVSGHAGLFSNAADLGIMMQMFLNKGSYGNQTFISDSTLIEFTDVQYKSNGNRRGVGFDKPVLTGKSGPTCYQCVSLKSFGHTGFTGITAWADPLEEVVYIFTSNRVYPIAENKKILTLNVRTNIQQCIYDAIKKSKD